MGLQAWGTYGILWPVVHFELGVAPDLGRGAVEVVPQIPDGQSSVAGRDIRLGTGSVDVAATPTPPPLTPRGTPHPAAALPIGAAPPARPTRTRGILHGAPVPRTVVPTPP